MKALNNPLTLVMHRPRCLATACMSTKATQVDYGQPPPTLTRLVRTCNSRFFKRSRHLVISQGRNFDPALCGATAGLALRAVENKGGLAGWEVREALWQAGCPYSVQRSRMDKCLGAPAPRDLDLVIQC